MNILYDPYIFRIQKAGGVNRYFSEIISHLPPDIRPLISKKINNHLHAPQNKNLQFFWLPENLLRSSFLLRLRMHAIDLLHPSYYQLCVPLTWTTIPCSVIITVYDFITARFDPDSPQGRKTVNNQRMAIQRADHIICISQATQNDLLERFPECASRSSVIPLAATLSPPPSYGPSIFCSSSNSAILQTDSKNLSEQKYFLYVGHRSFYKNFLLTLEVFSLVRKKYPAVRLVVAGSDWTDIEKEKIRELKLGDAIDLIRHPSDEMLATLYQHCQALFYLSQFEGFGLPPLEAMQMGIPVIALRTSSLPEVVGTGGILVEPLEATPQHIAEVAIMLLEENEGARQDRARKAIEQASRFSWEQTIQKTIHLYRQFSK